MYITKAYFMFVFCCILPASNKCDDDDVIIYVH